MNPQIWTFFLLITSVAYTHCQLSFDFTIDQASLSEPWMGDIGNFVIRDGRLYLNDSDARQSRIHLQSSLPDSMEIELLVGMNFPPSNQNYLKIDLWRSSLAQEADALYLMIGESGSTDAIELYQRTNGRSILLGSTKEGVLAQGAFVRINIIKHQSTITLSTDYEGGVRFNPEIVASIDPQISGSGYFLIHCNYSSTRSDKFFFDDLYIGDIRIDESPPSIVHVDFSESDIRFQFDEPLAEHSIDEAEIMVLPFGQRPIITKYNPLIDELLVSFSPVLPKQEELTLSVVGITDLSDNLLDTMIDFTLAKPVSPGDIIINEVLFNPIGDGSDYVELYNTTELSISLKDAILINHYNGDEVKVIDELVIAPVSYTVLVEDKENIISVYPQHDSTTFEIIDLPRFNNDQGNVTLLNAGREIIDEMNYDEDDHISVLDDVDGVSLERVGYKIASNNRSSWTSATEDSGFGTPGLPNSNVITEEKVSVEFPIKVFSPDDDGVDDLLLMNYSLDLTDYLATVRVYSDVGREVYNLSNNRIAGTSGKWSWNGTSNSGKKLNNGIYVIVIDLISLSGSRKRVKETVVLVK